MLMSRPNLGLAVLLLSFFSLVLIVSTPVPADARTGNTESMLTWASQNALNSQWLTMPDSKTRVRLWDEPLADGTLVPHFAISLDGSRIAVARKASYILELRYGSYDPLAPTAPAAPAHLAAQAGSKIHIVQFVTPPIEEYRQAVRAAGGTIYDYLPNYAYLVRLDQEARQVVEELPFVRWVGPYHPRYRVDENVYDTQLAAGSSNQDQPEIYTIQVFERGLQLKQIVAESIRQMGGTIELLIPDGFLLRASLTPTQLTALLNMDEVAFIDPWAPPSVDMNIARQIGNADYLETLGYTGQGVRAEVNDSNIRGTHVDFQDPPATYHGTHGGDSSHGTSTYGIVHGTGTGNATGTGMLADAEAKIFADYNYLNNEYTHNAELVDPDGPYRAVFVSRSWGGGRTLSYNSTSREMDDVLFINDIIICQSQSNAGDRMSRPQAWAKNIIAVGGVYHYNTLTKDDDRWNHGASIGPAADGRVKPDLTHFYDYIYCPSNSNDNAYTSYFGGTSGATPITAGYFGLLYQMWHEGVFQGFGGGSSVFESRPHMSTAKAIMICSAEQYPFELSDLTRMRQGWGMVDLGYLYDMKDNMSIINENVVLENLEMANYELEVAPGEDKLKVTMVYTDLPGNVGSGKHRINDITLSLTSPSGDRYWGNNGLGDDRWSTPGGDPNDIDTVENVFIENPEAGTWTIEIWASEIVEDAHLETPEVDADFALVTIGGTGQPGMFLNISPLVAGELATLTITNATPFAPVHLGFSIHGFGSQWFNAIGVMVDLENPVYAGSTPADEDGVAVFEINVPGGAQGRVVYIQAVENGRKSNAVMAEIQ